MGTRNSWGRRIAGSGGVGRQASIAVVASVVASLAVACGGGTPERTAVSDDLRRDLDLAASATVELASPAPRTRFVSAIERGADPAAAPARDRTPATAPDRPRARRAPAPAAGRAPGRAAARTASEVAEAPAPEGAMEPVAAPGGESAPAAVATAEPTPAPEIHEPGMGAGSGPSAGNGDTGEAGRGRGRGPGIGDVIGGVIGVVIRGGGVDGDHCERDRRGRGRYPGAGGGYPGPIVVVGPGTYPGPRAGRTGRGGGFPRF